MTQLTHEEIALAAINSAGPVINGDLADWQTRVAAQARTITVMLGESSAVMKTISNIAESKSFVATIVAAEKEQSSNRMKVTLAAKTGRSETEVARSERLEQAEGKAIAHQLWSLMFHRVIVHIQLEQMSGSDNKVRVVRYVEDLGVDPEHADAEATLRANREEKARLRAEAAAA